MLASSILLSSFTKLKLGKQKQLVSHFGDSSIKLLSLSGGIKNNNNNGATLYLDYEKRETHVCYKFLYLYWCAVRFTEPCITIDVNH